MSRTSGPASVSRHGDVHRERPVAVTPPCASPSVSYLAIRPTRRGSPSAVRCPARGRARHRLALASVAREEPDDEQSVATTCHRTTRSQSLEGTHLPHLRCLPSLLETRRPVCSPSSFKRNGPRSRAAPQGIPRYRGEQSLVRGSEPMVRSELFPRTGAFLATRTGRAATCSRSHVGAL